MKSAPKRLPCLFVNHGGGPMPLLGMDDVSKQSLQNISGIVSQHSKPKAILVISAHWEASPVRVTSSFNPSLLYDYYGFPKESYEYKYPSKGNPSLAKKIKDLLKSTEDIECDLDSDRGYDHGVFVPLLLAYPEADVPVVEISLHPSLDPSLHLKIGRALEPLRDEGVLILGSGMSFHNMRAFSRGGGTNQKKVGEAFDQALVAVVTNTNTTERAAQIKSWESLPDARFAHPREEHLAPLFVCIGAAGEGKGELTSADTILGAQVSAFSFS